MKVVRFAETRPLPSYLVAFAVGPFEIVDAGRSAKRKSAASHHRSRRAGGSRGSRARRSRSCSRGLEDYFGTPYPVRQARQHRDADRPISPWRTSG